MYYFFLRYQSLIFAALIDSLWISSNSSDIFVYASSILISSLFNNMISSPNICRPAVIITSRESGGASNRYRPRCGALHGVMRSRFLPIFSDGLRRRVAHHRLPVGSPRRRNPQRVHRRVCEPRSPSTSRVFKPFR